MTRTSRRPAAWAWLINGSNSASAKFDVELYACNPVGRGEPAPGAVLPPLRGYLTSKDFEEKGWYEETEEDAKYDDYTRDSMAVAVQKNLNTSCRCAKSKSAHVFTVF